ncbi:MAG: DHH family phosphoesterase [Clostridiales bacterium]|nr:DHH family phosphoesterase [Clostridiales bacterium]
MNLKQFLDYDNIVIQCHDIPDGDAIASGFALYQYIKFHNKDVRLVYSGRMEITKPNLLLMIEHLKIPIEYVVELYCKELLITVDCQYGAGNVTMFDAPTVAIIDHHQSEVKNMTLCEIRPYLGSCSTLVWKMFEEIGFDVNLLENVPTALYYGLYCDTNSFAEISHPLDKDLRDTVKYIHSLIKILANSNLTLFDLETAGVALIRAMHNKRDNFAIIKSNPCDPNILGFISDLAMQVNTINTCIVYSQTDDGLKFSVRSCIREVNANEMASYIAKDLGSGGGHKEKAGGFIFAHKFEEKHPNLNTEAYFLNQIRSYYDSFETIYSHTHHLSLDTLERYRKKHIPLGYVPSSEIFDKNTPLLIRTLEGDMNIEASEDTYIMIGLKGEAYPIKKEKFMHSYKLVAETYDLVAEYIPRAKNKITGDSIELLPYAKSCIATGDVYIYVKQLTQQTKVFTAWDTETYMTGHVGDYLAVREDDTSDIYILENNIFHLTYEKVK